MNPYIVGALSVPLIIAAGAGAVWVALFATDRIRKALSKHKPMRLKPLGTHPTMTWPELGKPGVKGHHVVNRDDLRLHIASLVVAARYVGGRDRLLLPGSKITTWGEIDWELRAYVKAAIEEGVNKYLKHQHDKEDDQ